MVVVESLELVASDMSKTRTWGSRREPRQPRAREVELDTHWDSFGTVWSPATLKSPLGLFGAHATSKMLAR